MPNYHNPTVETLTFELGPEIYTVPPGGTVEIPRQFPYEVYIKPRQLPLVPGAGADPSVQATVRDMPPPSQPSQKLRMLAVQSFDPRNERETRDELGLDAPTEQTAPAAKSSRRR